MKCIKCNNEAVAFVENKVYRCGIIVMTDWLCLEPVCREHYEEYRNKKSKGG